MLDTELKSKSYITKNFPLKFHPAFWQRIEQHCIDNQIPVPIYLVRCILDQHQQNVKFKRNSKMEKEFISL